MRLLGVLAVVTVAAAGPVSHALAAGPLGTASALVSVGPGVTESSQRQVVRSADGFVYIASVDDGGYSGGARPELHMYRSTTAGIPTAFRSIDAAHDPYADAPLDLSGGDARIDAAGTIHVTYAVTNLGDNSLTVEYQTFDTKDETWGPAQPVTKLTAEGDGIRGKVVSGLALDPAGTPLVVTASSSGVNAWSPTAGGQWSRAALSGEYGLHPSLAFDGSGRAHLSWVSDPNDTASIRYASRAPDGTWSAPEVVADQGVLSNTTSDQSPSLAFDAKARPIVLWLDQKDDVSISVRAGDSKWTREDPPPTFTHTPGLYVRGDDRLVFLGHDVNTHPAYLSYDAATLGWSDVFVFPPPREVSGFYGFDGSASARFDPLFDADCRIVDVAFFSEYSLQPGRIGKPDLYYASVTLPAPPGGCPPAAGSGGGGGSGPPTTPPPVDPPPTTPPPVDPPPTTPPPVDPPPTTPPPVDPPPTTPPPVDPPPTAPPPAHDGALLGSEVIAPQVDANAPGMAEAFQSVAGASGTVRSISLYVDASTTGDKLAVGLYADDGGHPGALLAQADATATADAWNTIALPATTVTAGDHYWLALVGTGQGRIAFRDDPQGPCRSETTPASLSLDALPTTWTTGDEWDDCPVSAYGA